MLAGTTVDSCAVSVPLAWLCAASGPGARQPHYLAAGTAGRWGGQTGACGLEGETRGARPSLALCPCSFRSGLGLRCSGDQGPAAWGWQVVASPWGSGPRLGSKCAGAHLRSHIALRRLRALPPWLLLTCSPPLPGLGRSPALWLSCSLCSLFPPLCPAPAMLSGCLCPWSLLQASLPALSPAVCISLSLQLSLFFPPLQYPRAFLPASLPLRRWPPPLWAPSPSLCLAPRTSACPGLVSMSLCPWEPVRGWGWGCL